MTDRDTQALSDERIKELVREVYGTAATASDFDYARAIERALAQDGETAKQIENLRIECDTLRHGLRLADNRAIHARAATWAEAIEAASKKAEFFKQHVVAAHIRALQRPEQPAEAPTESDGLLAALEACLDHGSMTGAEWVQEMARTAIDNYRRGERSHPKAQSYSKDADYADLYRFVRADGCNVAWAAIGAGECLAEFDKTIRAALAQQAGKGQGK